MTEENAEAPKTFNLDITKMKPIGDHVLVKPIPEDDELVAPGGTRFFLADTAKDKPNRGEVVAIGDGRVLLNGQLRPITVNPGDKVLFSKYAGNEFSLAGEQYIILAFDDILIVIG